MSDASKHTGSRAVFLSYASQDVELTEKICVALRAAGVEVWFDRTELRSGDAWDQSIKRQIRECALFLPVISSATQARREGYFRREWKIAVERTHDMDDGVPFLLPIALDGINESEAFVPEAFLRVQWTKLPGKEVPAAFVSRVRNLLSEEAPVRASGGGPVPPAAATPELEASRIVLARFENLSGDTSLDGVSRIIEGELVRGIAAAPHVRLLPVEASTRSAAREAARKEKAASVIIGSYYREGTTLLISAEVVLVDQGTTFGTLGPVTVPAGVRGEAWTEFVDRLTTGANNAVANLASEPLRISGLVYPRIWPRWMVAQQLNQLRAEEGKKSDAQMLAALREMLAKYPELVRAKVDIARLLRKMNRADEAEQQFNELLALGRQLSDFEINEISYDLALLQGKPEVALQAARGMLAIRDTRTEITQVLASLWALNRPRMAYEEIKTWWERLKPRVPEAQRLFPEVGLRASQINAELAHDDQAAAEKHVAELKTYTTGRQIPTVLWVEARLLALQGRVEPLKALLAEAGAMPADTRVEPALLAFYAQGILLHRGFAKEAAEMDQFLAGRLADLPASVRESEQLAEADWHVAMLEKRYDSALEKIASYKAREIAPPIDLLGYRALTLQKQGNEAAWRALDAELEKTELRNTRGMTFYWRARLAAGNGERKRATDLLEQAVANGLWFRSFQGGMSDLGKVEPEFAPLRGYAPYDLLLKPKD